MVVAYMSLRIKILYTDAIALVNIVNQLSRSIIQIIVMSKTRCLKLQ